ncbi:O-antigen ligase family protein [Oceanobacter sp. 5_MG-2023]|uniref:O-antigen ligase family protein n=1 Tax=Oceanobacter sp. 5_MG-2023 TaxID=3062645 RepID=UPI0026E2F025|nr:O-antigen ligase family protein [Oceanobacter sp. 5_MG-2023]MDO6681318.1 O-antigen ligase family protein [Oceanobacter sp. 5_MG-2023]
MTRWRAYLLLLFVLPLPFGGYTDWAWPLYTAITSGLLLLELRLHTQNLTTLPVAFVRSRWLWVGLLLIQLWVAAQALWISSAHYDTWMYLFKGFGYAGFFMLTLLLVHSQNRIQQAIWTIVLAAAFQASYGSLMVLTGWEYGFFEAKWAYTGTATGTFVNRNHIAGYLEMALALGIGFLLAQSTVYRGSLRQRLRQAIQVLLSSKVILRLLLAIMVIALVMTRSRMGNTAFFASMMIAGALALVLMRHKSKSTTILLASLLVIDIAIVGTFFGVDKVAERLQNSSVDTESRDEVTRDSFLMWQQQPFRGIGAGSFQTTFPKYKSPDVVDSNVYNHTHNDYVQFLAEFGAPAFAVMLGVVLVSLWRAIRAMSVRRNELLKGAGFGATMGIIAIGIHSAVDFNLQIPANAYMFMFLLAMANIARWAEHGPRAHSSVQRTPKRAKHHVTHATTETPNP